MEYYAYDIPSEESFREIIGKTERIGWSTLAKNCSFGTLRIFAASPSVGVNNSEDVKNGKPAKEVVVEPEPQVGFSTCSSSIMVHTWALKKTVLSLYEDGLEMKLFRWADCGGLHNAFASWDDKLGGSFAL